MACPPFVDFSTLPLYRPSSSSYGILLRIATGLPFSTHPVFAIFLFLPPPLSRRLFRPLPRGYAPPSTFNLLLLRYESAAVSLAACSRVRERRAVEWSGEEGAAAAAARRVRQKRSGKQ